MNLFQCILFNEENKVENFLLSKNEEIFVANKFIHAFGLVELDFHPFKLEAFLDQKFIEAFNMQINQKKFSLSLKIVDEKERKPFFSNVTQGQSLLLFSELVKNFYDSFDKVGWSIEKIIPDIKNENLSICISLQQDQFWHNMLGQGLIAGAIIESVLCVRGLFLEKVTITKDCGEDYYFELLEKTLIA